MKKILVLGLAALSMSSAFAASSHSNYVGSVDKFSGTITNQDQFDDLIKYTDYKTQAKLKASFQDGKLTAEEIKSSGISDHHFYTGLLSSSKTQGEYDKYLKQMNGLSSGESDDHFVSNRDMKAHGSMVMNQVDTKLQLQAGAQNQVDVKQDQRVDKIVAGLQDLGNHIQAQVPTLPPVENNNPDPKPGYDDTAIKNQVNTNTGNIATNTNNIQQVGAAVDKIAGSVTTNTGNIEKNSHNIGLITNYLKATAAETAAEIARLDGRIDSLEKKTDKMKAGIAGSTAIASLTQYTGNGTHHVAVGIGGYDGASALAGGYTYAISVNTTIRGTVAYDSEGEFGFGASVGHSW